MSTENDTTRKNDTPPRIVGHRLQKTAFQSPRATNSVDHSAAHHSVLRQIVLVDRDIDAMRDIAIALREDYEFHISISGNEALALLQDGSIDTIIVGQTLYSGTGIGVLAAARRHAPHTRRVLLANAAEASGLNQSSSQAGPFHVMSRPCTPDKLREFLENPDEASQDRDDHNAERLASTIEIPAPATNSNKREAALSRSTNRSNNYTNIDDALDQSRTLKPTAARPIAAKPVATRPTINEAPTEEVSVEHVVLETSQANKGRGYSSRRTTNAANSKLPVVVFTDDSDFYQSILAAIQDLHVVRVATQIETVVELAEVGMCALLITDCAATQSELQRISIAVRTIEPNVVVIAAGPLQDSQGLRQLIGTPALHCFLPKPISAQLTKLAIESACRQHLQLKSPLAIDDALNDDFDPAPTPPLRSHLITSSMPVMNFMPINLAERDSYDRVDWRPVLKIGSIVLASVIAVIAVIYATQSYHDWLPTSRVDKLQLAQKAINEGHDFEPASASASYYYQQVLAEDPNNSKAKEGLQKLVDQLVSRTEQSLLTDHYDDAALSLQQLRALQPSHQRIAYLDAQLQKSRRNTDPSSKSKSSLLSTDPVNAAGSNSLNTVATIGDAQRKQTTVPWLQTARERMDQRRFVNPENDSAESYLRQVARIDPTNPVMLQMLREIGTNLINDARRALEAKQLTRARTLITDAERFDGAETAASELRRQIDSTESNDSRARTLNLVLQRTRDNQLLDPERDSAKYYLDQLQQLDATSAEFEQGRRAVGLKLVDNATQAIARQQYNLAIRMLSEVRAIGFQGQELNDADQRLRNARSPSASTVTPTSTVPAANSQSASAAVNPAANSTTPKSPVANKPSTSTMPKAIKTVPLRYPTDALNAGIEGWVDVRFHLNSNGTVADASSVETNTPERYAEQFQKAAVDAIRDYIFEPATDNERATRSMTIRIQFRMK